MVTIIYTYEFTDLTLNDDDHKSQKKKKKIKDIYYNNSENKIEKLPSSVRRIIIL